MVWRAGLEKIADATAKAGHHVAAVEEIL